jgi:hypothetical protein
MRKCLLVIIGTQGKLRSKSLNELTECFSDCIYINPVFLDRTSRTEQVVNDKLCEVAVGRFLTNSEVGCVVAHKNATAVATDAVSNSNEVEWVLFVEDDADLDPSTFERIQSELEGLKTEIPSLVTYYSSKNCGSGIEETKSNSCKRMKSSIRWSSGTVCYAINRTGLFDIAAFSELPVDHVADWPIYYTRLKLYFSIQVRVCEVDEPSTIVNRRNLSISSRIFMHLRQIIYLRRLSRLNEVPVYKVINHLMITPIMRDFSNRIRSFQIK